ncbi:MAG: aconitase family protein, partial [Acidimicrobiia bacterium]
GVTAKDLILSIIGDHGMSGALYQVLEFGGTAIDMMSVEERSVLTNMCAEIGAKTGIVAGDEVTSRYLAERGVDVGVGPQSDDDAQYSTIWRYDASSIGPVVARPNRHDDVVPVAEVGNAPVTRAYIGACTGAKHSDLVMAAAVLKGRSVAPGVLLQVAPASQDALDRAVRDGTASILIEAGAHILSTGCGACPGIGSGVLGPGEICISTTSRNSRGRMGSPDASVYLGSAYSVAAAAVAGEIVDPREMIGATS